MLKVIKSLKNVCKTGAFAIRSLSSSAAPFSEQKAHVDGIDINYVQSGQASGQHAVLLMPGALGSAWTDFKPQIGSLPALLPDATIIAWDPPGYGKSIPPKRNFDLDFFERDAKAGHALMRTLGFKQFSILGWSDGGITGLIIAGRFPDAVRRLVVWGSNAYLLPEEVKIYQGIRDVQKWSPRMREPLEKLYGKEYFAQAWADWVDLFERLLKERDGDLCRNVLKDIRAPTLVVHGAKDPMIAPEHVPYLLKNIREAESFIFEDGKHNIHLRYADKFNEVVANFLKK